MARQHQSDRLVLLCLANLVECSAAPRLGTAVERLERWTAVISLTQIAERSPRDSTRLARRFRSRCKCLAILHHELVGERHASDAGFPAAADSDVAADVAMPVYVFDEVLESELHGCSYAASSSQGFSSSLLSGNASKA